jgi:CBS domain-containing protein
MSTVRDLMTTDLVTCPPDASIAQAAALMRDHSIGDVLVTQDGALRGIVTDRDIVVRCLADGAAPTDPIASACSERLATVPASATAEDAARVMREHSLRRLPVIDDGVAVGIITLGDLAVDRAPDSALGSISASRPTS